MNRQDLNGMFVLPMSLKMGCFTNYYPLDGLSFKINRMRLFKSECVVQGRPLVGCDFDSLKINLSVLQLSLAREISSAGPQHGSIL